MQPAKTKRAGGRYVASPSSAGKSTPGGKSEARGEFAAQSEGVWRNDNPVRLLAPTPDMPIIEPDARSINANYTSGTFDFPSVTSAEQMREMIKRLGSTVDAYNERPR